MNASEIRDLSTDDIKAKLADTRDELMRLRFQQVMGQLTDSSRLRHVRHDIARLATVLSEREKSGQ